MERKGISPSTIKNALNMAVATVVRQKHLYVRNPNADFTRNRKLTMADVIKLILSMEGGSLNKELHAYSQSAGKSLTAAAFIQQRSKISAAAFHAVFRLFNEHCCDDKTYRGYHLLAVDGSDINQFRNPHADTYVKNSSHPKGYNQTHLNALYDLCNKTYVDIELQPRPAANEHKAFLAMLQRGLYPDNSIILADRGYESYNTFAHLLEKRASFLFRIKNGNGAMTAVKNLPMEFCDRDVTIELTTTQTKEDKQRGRRFLQTGSKKGKVNSPATAIQQWDFPSPYTMSFRVVRFQLDTGEYETIATSLPREAFPPEEIKKLYHLRWGIETSFRELKYNVGLTNLHCKKEELVQQEIYAALIMYNFCSRITNTVNLTFCPRKRHHYKISFSMAVYLCRMFYKTVTISADDLLRDLACYLEPIRPGRQDERRMSKKKFIGFVYRIAA